MDVLQKQQSGNADAEAMLRAFDNTSVCIFMYFPMTKTITVPQKTCSAYHCSPVYTHMPDSFAEEAVYESDCDVFKEMYYKIDQGENTASARFRSKDLNFCWNVTLTVLSRTDQGQPAEAFGIIEDVTEAFKKDCLVQSIRQEIRSNDLAEDDTQEVMNLIASVIGGLYYAIYHIRIKDHTYICFQEKMPGVLSETGKKGIYEPYMKSYVEDQVEPEDRKAMMEFTDFSTLAQRLKNDNIISHVYRRKENGWTRGQFIAAKRDAEGNAINIIYTVRDINTEVEWEDRQKQAVYEAKHDPMTGVFNRKGFEQMIEMPEMKNQKIGFILVDVDNFKTLNDTYGHDVGDQVLTRLAQCFTESFRSYDSVFRFGGDEFGILLRECGPEVWQTICRKQENIHQMLQEYFPKLKNISISMGICFSENGYNEKMYSLADEALYEAKRNGRSGCTLIDGNHKILKKWRDEKTSLHAESALDRSATGMYRMEFSEDLKVLPRMICNETAKIILGVNADTTPEECYRVWKEGIDPSYLEALAETKHRMIHEHQAECTYLWNHPKWGQIYVRSGGYGESSDGMEILYGYHHALKDTEIIERRDDNKKIVDALNDMFFASYYINLQTQTFSIVKAEDYAKSMLAGCQSIAEGFQRFIATLIIPEYAEKMQDFCNIDTLSERLKKYKHIDCEYKSRVAEDWCQASFIPVDYDENGTVVHTLFVVSSIDAGKVKEIEEGIYNKKSLKALFNNVPGGIVMYEWDGKQLKTLHISDYYVRQYGASMVSGGSNKGGPDFSRVHPDDVEEYQKALFKGLNENRYIKYVYRVWNQKEKRYIWVKLDAVSEQQPDGTSLVYAMFSDVTEQKEAEQRLEKNQVSFTAALKASSQFCYEYDPIRHTADCYTDENFFGLPKHLNDYPECIRDIKLVHPEDIDLFIGTAHEMDNGAETAHCDIRAWKDGKYIWYSCTFNAYFDPSKERNVAILTVIDISVRMAMIKNYEERLQSLIGLSEKSLILGRFNLTRNTYRSIRAEKEMRSYIDENKTFEELMMHAAESVVGKQMQEEYTKLFRRDNLLAMAEKGKMHVQMEHLFRISENHTEWLETVLDMVRNPITGEIAGVCYSRSIQDVRMTELLLNKTLQQDYLMTAVIMTDTDEYYLYDSRRKTSVGCRYHFWDNLGEALIPIIQNMEKEQISEIFSKEKVMTYLKNGRDYRMTFGSKFSDEKCRLEIRFSGLDFSEHMIFVSLRDITDQMLLEKLRYDSEHDPLTDLFNRKKAFNKCRTLLQEYPEEQFVMAHIDMKHFHLYNTFFGDEAGDQLLCDIADLFRELDKDYAYWAYGRIEADVFCAFFPFNQELYNKQLDYILHKLQDYRRDFVIEPVIGLYFVKDRHMPIESMFTRASIAAKSVHSGMRGISVVYDDGMERKLTDEQRVVNEMQNAIENGQFQVYLQPKYSLQTNQAVGAEALVRWIHPQRGMVSPAQFIPVFERNGFIAELDRYMWEQVCQLLCRWKEEGRPMLPVSVNVSRISMFSPTTVQFLKDLIQKYKMDPRYLELELTESVYIDDPDEMKQQISELQAAGFKILMDDFGSGYSSLNALKELPVDCLKLDIKFLSHSENDARGSMVLSSIVRMSKLLNLFAIAEGVETKEQADFLRSIGCEYVQGFLFAHPMTVAEYEEILDQEEILHEGNQAESIGQM